MADVTRPKRAAALPSAARVFDERTSWGDSGAASLEGAQAEERPARCRVSLVPRIVEVADRLTGSWPVPTAAAVTGLVAFGIYWLTLLPGVSFGDWAEMQSIPYSLGIAHPTGYPLYVLLGKLWSFLPIGSVAYRANLLSAVYAASAVGCAVLLMGRLHVRATVGASAALLLAANPTTWEAATTARVDALHLLFCALILHRALVWADDRRHRDLYLLALLVGLSFANHMLTATVAPLVGVFVLVTGGRDLIARPRPYVIAGLFLALGLAVYLYIPLRAAAGPAWAYGSLTTLAGLIDLVRGSMFQGDMRFLGFGGLQNFVQHAAGVAGVIVARWNGGFLLCGLLGWVVLLRRNLAFALLSAGLGLVNVYVYVNYVGHLEHYLLLSWLLLAVWIGVAVDAVVALAIRRQPDANQVRRHVLGVLRSGSHVAHPGALEPVPGSLATVVREGGPVATGPRSRRSSLAVSSVLGLILLIAPATVVAGNWSSQDRSHDHRGEQFVAQVFARLPRGAVLFTYWDAIEPLWYAHCVEGERPDLVIVARSDPRAQGCQAPYIVSDALVRSRPTFALLPFRIDYVRLSMGYHLEQVAVMLTPYGDPFPRYDRPLMRLTPSR